MLEKAPAIAVELISAARSEPAEDSKSQHSTASSDGFDAASERLLCRLVVAPFALKVCSGSIHRLKMILFSANQYEGEGVPATPGIGNKLVDCVMFTTTATLICLPNSREALGTS